MNRLYFNGSLRTTIYLRGGRIAKLVNISPCDFMILYFTNPDALLSIEIGGKRATARAKDLTFTP